MTDFKISITKAFNGYILEWDEETDNGIVHEKEVIEDDDTIIKDIERESMTRMLYRVAYYFGELGDKYSKKNLNISWDKKGKRCDDEDNL